VDDFEAFRKKKMERKKAEAQADKIDEQNKMLGWIDGIGPAGPTNPKVKGFMLGRYWTKKVDPKTLKKPAGYEGTALDEDANKARMEREALEAAVQKIRDEAERKIAALYARYEAHVAKEQGQHKPLRGFKKF
jgi:hypothetical protein